VAANLHGPIEQLRDSFRNIVYASYSVQFEQSKYPPPAEAKLPTQVQKSDSSA